MEVVGELPDGAEVGLLSALGLPGELEVVGHGADGATRSSLSPLATSEEINTARNYGLRRRRVLGIDESVEMPMTDEGRRYAGCRRKYPPRSG